MENHLTTPETSPTPNIGTTNPLPVATVASENIPSDKNLAVKPSGSWKDRFTWPRLWEFTLAFILVACALFIAQSAWKIIRPPEPLAAAPAGIDLNSADVAALKQLPGVGPHLAARIVEHREKNGPFVTVDDLRAVKGIGPVTLERLRSAVCVAKPEANDPNADATLRDLVPAQPLPTQPSGPKKGPDKLIDLNTASKEELIAIPGIGATIAERIIEDRQTKGLYRSVSDLTRIKGIKAKTVEKLAPYVKVEAKRPG